MITRKEIDLAAPLTTPQIEMLTALAAAPSAAKVSIGSSAKRIPASSQVTQIHRKSSVLC